MLPQSLGSRCVQLWSRRLFHRSAVPNERRVEMAQPAVMRWVTHLVRPLINLNPLTAVSKHLRHEREASQAATLIQGRENLLYVGDLDPSFAFSATRWLYFLIRRP